MPWSAYVNQCGDPKCEDHIVEICHHEHRTRNEAIRCSDRMLAGLKVDDAQSQIQVKESE